MILNYHAILNPDKGNPKQSPQVNIHKLFSHHLFFFQDQLKLHVKGFLLTLLLMFMISSVQSQSPADPLRDSLRKAIRENDMKSEAEFRLKIVDQNKDLMQYDQLLEEITRALHLYEQLNDSVGIAMCRLALQANFRAAKDYRSALENSFIGLRIAVASKARDNIFFTGEEIAPLFLGEISQTYFDMNILDSAAIYDRKAIEANLQTNGSTWNFPYYLQGIILTAQGRYDSALISFRKAWPLAVPNGFPSDTIQIASGLSTLYRKMGRQDSAIFYAMTVVNKMDSVNESSNIMSALSNLVEIYKKQNKKDSALKYLEMRGNFRDSLYSDEKIKSLRNLASREVERQQEIAAAKQQYRNNIRTTILFAGLIGLIVIASLLWRNNVHRKKSYVLLEKQKKETEEQKAKAESALENLKAAQNQLVQSEKMASLGELTAGIAHEIQNPLNFVNNFADLNAELLKELELAMNSNNKQEINRLIQDMNTSLLKISHHGKRADSIVKGMLLHSRLDKGHKEPTDINKLADEYLRLAYHGMRSKETVLHVTIQSDFDESVGMVPVVSQDIGRVLLNLFNNAFYEVMHKTYVDGDEPKVKLTTKRNNSVVEIRIRDNGMGIPQKVKDKIFQPFFTTKPPGQGTGLGLSLSYDIIVKEHEGEIRVNTEEGRSCEFIISIPGIISQ